MQTFRSRFGFHSCDLETFLNLKDLQQYCWMSISGYKAYERWERKHPKNRVNHKYIYNEKKQRCGIDPNGTVKIPEPPLFCMLFFGYTAGAYIFDMSKIFEDYRNARTPRKEDEVVPLYFSPEKIAEMLKAVTSWYATNTPQKLLPVRRKKVAA